MLTRRKVLGFRLSLTGARQGLAAWVAGECTFDAAAGNSPGPVLAAVLSAGKFGKPLKLTPAAAEAIYSNAVAVPGGGTVTWATTGPHGPETFSLPIGAGGLPGTIQQMAGGLIALTADGGGDEVFAWPPYNLAISRLAPFVRPAGGGADQPAPGSSGQLAVAAPLGRAAASRVEHEPHRQRADHGAVGMGVTASRGGRAGGQSRRFRLWSSRATGPVDRR